MQKNISSLFKILWKCKGVYKYRGTLSARAPAWGGGLIYEMIAYDDVEKNEKFDINYSCKFCHRFNIFYTKIQQVKPWKFVWHWNNPTLWRKENFWWMGGGWTWKGMFFILHTQNSANKTQGRTRAFV